MVDQQRLDRVAQQRGMVAGQRRDEQYGRLGEGGDAGVRQSFLKCSRLQNGFSSTISSTMPISSPLMVVVFKPKAGFWYSLPKRYINSYPAAIRCENGVCANGETGLENIFDDASAHCISGVRKERCISCNW